MLDTKDERVQFAYNGDEQQVTEKDKCMIDGKLCASANPGKYAVGSPYNSDLTPGQTIELLLGGQWISGQIAVSDHNFNSSGSTVSELRTHSVGAYQLPNNVEDTVTEASEESFPASDPPAWSAAPDQSPADTTNIANGYYFVADSDNTICGLCIGMHMRIKDTSNFLTS